MRESMRRRRPTGIPTMTILAVGSTANSDVPLEGNLVVARNSHRAGICHRTLQNSLFHNQVLRSPVVALFRPIDLHNKSGRPYLVGYTSCWTESMAMPLEIRILLSCLQPMRSLDIPSIDDILHSFDRRREQCRQGWLLRRSIASWKSSLVL